MAVQFPNFLSVPVRTPDWSGIGDIVQNYYAGKQMPKDDLIKKVQAEFARPTAEQALLAEKLQNTSRGLTNRKAQLEINQLVKEMQDQAAFEKQFRQALSGNTIPTSTATGTGLPVQQQQVNAPTPTQTSRVAAIPGVNVLGQGSEVDEGIDRTKMDPRYRRFDQEATGLPLSAYTGNPKDANKFVTSNAPIAPPISSNAPIAPPVAPTPSEPEIHETVIEKGSPHLVGVDQMYETNPLSRAFLEKKGYKKSQEVKFDNKTGRTTIRTTYPSGKITIRTFGGNTAVSSDNVPLTTKSLNDTVKQVRATDAVMPYIDELIRMADKGELPSTYWMPTDAQATYHRVANEALDKYMVATGLNATDKSLDTIREILFRSFGESTKNYLKGLKTAKANKERERKQNIKMINEGLSKNVSLEPSSEQPQYSSDEWEPA